MPLPAESQVFGPVVTLEALPIPTREALARALASLQDAWRRTFRSGATTENLDLREVQALRSALEDALSIFAPLALPGSRPTSKSTYPPTVFNPGDHLLLCHTWALEQALNHQEAPCSR